MKKNSRKENTNSGMKDLPLFKDGASHGISHHCDDSGHNVICFITKTQEKHNDEGASNRKRILQSLLDHADKLDW